MKLRGRLAISVLALLLAAAALLPGCSDMGTPLEHGEDNAVEEFYTLKSIGNILFSVSSRYEILQSDESSVSIRIAPDYGFRIDLLETEEPPSQALVDGVADQVIADNGLTGHEITWTTIDGTDAIRITGVSDREGTAYTMDIHLFADSQCLYMILYAGPKPELYGEEYSELLSSIQFTSQFTGSDFAGNSGVNT